MKLSVKKFLDAQDEVFKHNVTTKDDFGRSLLHVASSLGNNDVIKYLTEKGLHPEDPDSLGLTSLDLALINNKLDTAKLLLTGNNKMDPNSLDQFGKSAMHKAINPFTDTDSINNFALLLEHGASPDLTDKDGNTPLHLATANGLFKIVNLFLEYDADPNQRNNEKQTAIHFAARNNRGKVLRELLNREVEINIQDSQGRTALHLAAEEAPNTTKILLDKGADVNILDTKGRNALHYANLEYTAKLLASQKGVDINQQDFYGQTPLHLAVKQGKGAVVVKALIDAGARIDIRDNQGKIPVDYAIHQSDKEASVFDNIVTPSVIDLVNPVNQKYIKRQAVLDLDKQFSSKRVTSQALSIKKKNISSRIR
jgi:serine/threonine-protein phosphatase 6 regulatory ankyrin repeat subunit A